MRININGKPHRLSWTHINGEQSMEEDQRLLQVCVQREGNQQEGYRFFTRVKGYTGCFLYPITTPPSEHVSGEAWCSVLDDFSKEAGRKHSLANAMKNLQLSRNERQQVWEQYFARK